MEGNPILAEINYEFRITKNPPKLSPGRVLFKESQITFLVAFFPFFPVACEADLFPVHFFAK